MIENELKIGIDFSLNSPSICIKYKKDNNEQYSFCSFFNSDGKKWKEKDIKSFKNHKQIYNNNYQDLHIIEYQRKITSDDYTEKESQKIEDANTISKLIVNYIKQFIVLNNLEIKNIFVAIEGFSFGSKGASYIDLIMYNSFLRKELAINLTQPYNIKIFSPKHAKKLTGNGNADKEYMIKSFIENKLQDELIQKTGLYHYCKSFLDIKNVKPIDDLVDSYFILKCLD